MLFVFKIFEGHKQHPETFAMLLVQVLVVHFVGPPDGFRVIIIGMAEEFKALVYENVMHDEIGQAICEYSQTNGQANREDVILPQQEKTNADDRVEYKKGIISLKPRIMVFFMVIGVKHPQKAMHDVLVAEPCHEFHKKEGEKEH